MKKEKNVGKKIFGIFLILIVIAIGIGLSVLFTKLYINSGARAVIFYGWIPIPFIAIPTLIPVGLAWAAASSIKEKFLDN
jgi:hypothetical protein